MIERAVIFNAPLRIVFDTIVYCHVIKLRDKIFLFVE